MAGGCEDGGSDMAGPVEDHQLTRVDGQGATDRGHLMVDSLVHGGCPQGSTGRLNTDAALDLTIILGGSG